jgi:Protein of unknown function (DUF4232)
MISWMRWKIALAVAVFVCVAPYAGRGAALSFTTCRLSQFAIRTGPAVSEKTGQHTLILRLMNRGRGACVLNGYPRIRAYDKAGLVPFVIRHGGDQMITSRPPRRIVVRPRRAAFVALNHYRCDRGDVRVATRLRIDEVVLRLRGLYQTIEYCGRGDPGSTLAVSPFEPTLLATLAR